VSAYHFASFIVIWLISTWPSTLGGRSGRSPVIVISLASFKNQRSVARNASLCGQRGACHSVTLVVSMTSVSPSQRPTEKLTRWSGTPSGSERPSK
jgi:hypothetical protein